MKKRLQPLFLFFLLLGACSQGPTINNSTVAAVDLNRYEGTWYEIARLPNRFEKGLVGVTASYVLRDDGKIRVINSGRKGTLDGKIELKGGLAKIPDPAEPGKLKVSFFLFFYGDYNILELDTVNYSYALIGSSTPDYLWILSRTPQMDSAVYELLIEKAEQRGYDLTTLERIPQPEN